MVSSSTCTSIVGMTIVSDFKSITTFLDEKVFGINSSLLSWSNISCFTGSSRALIDAKLIDGGGGGDGDDLILIIFFKSLSIDILDIDLIIRLLIALFEQPFDTWLGQDESSATDLLDLDVEEELESLD